MRVHAFLARPAELPGLLAGDPPGVPLTDLDPLSLSALAEIVTGGEVPSARAALILRSPVLGGGTGGPSIYAVPDEITEALANSEPSERARWIARWTGQVGAPRGQALAAVAELAAGRDRGQSLYVWAGP